ncbi:hypothetical protein [Streptomyces sp. KL110A]
MSTAPAAYAEAPEDTFAFGLDALLDGLTARLPRRAPGPRGLRPRPPAR